MKKVYAYSEFETGVWGLIFNLNGEFSNQNYRIELAATADFFASDERFSNCNFVIPYSVSVGENIYREISGEIPDLKSGESSFGLLSGLKMIMPKDTGLRADMGRVMQNWQTECGFYCSISELDISDYMKSLNSGDFDIALVKISGEYNSHMLI